MYKKKIFFDYSKHIIKDICTQEKKNHYQIQNLIVFNNFCLKDQLLPKYTEYAHTIMQ